MTTTTVMLYNDIDSVQSHPNEAYTMKLLYDAHLAYRKIVAKKLMQYGLKSGNCRILTYVSDHPGCLQKDIAENCDVETSTLSTVLSNMEKKGFIERKRFEKNNRSHSIYVTEKGKKIANDSHVQLNVASDIAFKGFTKEEIDEFRTYLKRVIKNLKSSNM